MLMFRWTRRILLTIFLSHVIVRLLIFSVVDHDLNYSDHLPLSATVKLTFSSNACSNTSKKNILIEPWYLQQTAIICKQVFIQEFTSGGVYAGSRRRKRRVGWSVRRGFPPPQPTRGYTRSVVSSPSEIRRGPQTHFWHILRPQNASGREKTRSSADADNRLDAFSGQSRSTNMVGYHSTCNI